MPTMTPRSELDRLRGVITGAGHAWTRPRAAVVRVLIGTATPLKVEEIHERLGHWPGGRRTNLSSVYRTVNLLHALGVVRRVQFGDGPLRYELAETFRAHHHHFVCEACGRIEDVRRCPLEGADLGVGVRSHHLELFGVCRRCAPGEAEGRVRV
jgi:Fe2+ or Zn2+ uptake regulation protein